MTGDFLVQDENRRILAIDPGIAKVGWAMVERNDPKPADLLAWGYIETPPRDGLAERIDTICADIWSYIGPRAPRYVLIEGLNLFFQRKNWKALMKYAAGWGAIYRFCKSAWPAAEFHFIEPAKGDHFKAKGESKAISLMWAKGWVKKSGIRLEYELTSHQAEALMWAMLWNPQLPSWKEEK